MLELNKLYNMDCQSGISLLDDHSVDLVVTSPPYNVDLGNNKFHDKPYDTYKDNKPHQEYIAWLKSIFSQLFPKVKYGGRVVINIGDGENGAISTHSDIIQFMKEIGYDTYTTIIWDKSQVGSRTAWGSFQSPSCPSFPTPFEYILVFYKGSKSLAQTGKTDLSKEEFIEWSLPIWRIAPENRQQEFGHNAMFPEELPYRCIKMFSWIGATVVDIFSGLGTTVKVAKQLNRQFIGFELSPNYHKKALERISQQTIGEYLK